MTILKRKIRRARKEEGKFLGILVSKKPSSYLSLYCLAMGFTKSYIIKSLIDGWIKNAEKTFSEQDLIKNIAERAIKIWDNPVRSRKNFHTFKSELRIELGHKGLADYADSIIKAIENEKNKEK